jgi:hypothetical protein
LDSLVERLFRGRIDEARIREAKRPCWKVDHWHGEGAVRQSASLLNQKLKISLRGYGTACRRRWQLASEEGRVQGSSLGRRQRSEVTRQVAAVLLLQERQMIGGPGCNGNAGDKDQESGCRRGRCFFRYLRLTSQTEETERGSEGMSRSASAPVSLLTGRMETVEIEECLRTSCGVREVWQVSGSGRADMSRGADEVFDGW